MTQETKIDHQIPKIKDTDAFLKNTSPKEKMDIPLSRQPFYKRPLWIFVLLLVFVLIAGTGAQYWMHIRQFESTDDAFIDGDIVQISPKVSGIIASVYVEDNQDVAAGTVLLQIDPKDFEARLNEARASLMAAEAKLGAAKAQVDVVKASTEAVLEQAKAGVEQAKAAIESSLSQLASAQADVAAAEAEAIKRQADLKRFKSLDSRVVSQQQLDNAQAASDTAEAYLISMRKRVLAAEAAVKEAQAKYAQSLAVLAAAETGPQQVAAAIAQMNNAQSVVDEAKAKVEAAELNLSYTTIRAPVSGRVTKRTARPGQYLQVGQNVLALVQPDVWVTANFKETQLTFMRQGQNVEIKVDAYPMHVFHGYVDSIQAGTGSRFSMLPPENATGNYVKVVQRVPVKIRFDQKKPHEWLLAPGMSVIPTVHIGRKEQQHPNPILPPSEATVSETAEFSSATKNLAEVGQ